MTEEIRFSPRAKNRSAQMLGAGLLLPAVVLLLLSLRLPSYRGVVQTVALLFLVAALYVFYRYSWVKYVYILTNPEEKVKASLLVEQVQGHRASLIARVPLRGFLSVQPFAAAGISSRACYTYRATMCGAETVLVRARVAGEVMQLRLEADDDFCAALCDAAAAAKEAAAKEDAE